MVGTMFTVSEMAKLARVSRDTLLFYDRIGLFSPEIRGNNNYRYYSDRQVSQVNLIRTLQILGMPLKDISDIAKCRTPELVFGILEKQTLQIENNLKELLRTRQLLATFKSTIGCALSVDESAIELLWFDEEAVYFGPENDYSNGRTFQDALLDFYRGSYEKDPDLDLNYSAWGEFSGERIRNNDWMWPNKYYFNDPSGPDRKPAGWYVSGYTRGNYGSTDDLYQRLLAYIKQNGLTITGPCYEMYPLNEISIVDPDNYLIHVTIKVEEPTAFFDKK